MKFKLLTLLAAAAALLPLKTSAADERLISGRLDNGLTYYIYPNDAQKGRADFFLSRSIGSLAERDDEQGLAHFLEHIAFNGSKHFPGNSMIEWLESVGVKFGRNLNAYTAIDETVYNISEVPTERRAVVDSCLLILRDWSSSLSLLDADIEAERGVIKGEWRHRNTAANRLLQKAAPRIYGNSVYGRRLPMGRMEIVESFPPKRLRNFYKRNYTADSEAIIVVGDIDAAAIEREIKRLFADVPKGRRAKLPDRNVPLGEPLKVVAEADPEQSVEMVQLYFRHPKLLTAKEKAAAAMLTTMLVERLDRLELTPDAPITNIGVGDTRFLLSDTIGALLLRGNARAGKAAQAVEALTSEIVRALQHGFLPSEFADAKFSLSSEAKADLEKAKSRSNTQIAREISKAFLHGRELSTPQEDYEENMAALASLTKEAVENYLAAIALPSGRDVVLMHYSRFEENATPAAEKALADAFATAMYRQTEPYDPAATIKELIINIPKKGGVAAVDEHGPFNTEVVTLSNGIPLYLRYSDAKPGQIYLRGVGTGGLSINYSPEKAPSLKLLNDVLAVSAVGDMDNSDYRRFTHGKTLKVAAMVGNTDETIEFSTSPQYLEDAFKLMYLKATDLRKDENAFRTLIESKRAQMANRSRNPIQTMGDSITLNAYSRHPLGALPSPEMIEKVDYDVIMATYRDRFADFADFRFYITGDFNRDSLISLAETYIASLPVGGRIEKPRDIAYRFSPTKEIRFSMPMSTPVSVVYRLRHFPTEYNLDNIIAASATGQILKSRLLKSLREEKGWTYSITSHGSVTAGINGDDEPQFMMPIYVKVDPDHTAEAEQLIDATMLDIARGNISSDEIEKVKEFMLKNIADNRRDNAYWLIALRQLHRSGIDLDTDYEKAAARLDAAAIKKLLKPIADSKAETLSITMTPE